MAVMPLPPTCPRPGTRCGCDGARRSSRWLRIELIGVDHAHQALAAARPSVEGVPEMLEVRRDAFDWANRCCRDDAIGTSRISSIRVTQLAGRVKHPARLLNVHWLNPACIIPVVELSTHAGTSPP